MRLFVGVEVTDEVRRMGERAAGDLQAVLPNDLRARWVPVENLHLTVRFIGHVDDDNVKAVTDALAPTMPEPAFEIELSGCGRFPAKGVARVLWIGLTAGLTELARTHHECNRRLRPLGYRPEERPFSAHLTLARLKEAPPGSSRAIQQAIDTADTGIARFTVDHLTIFESRLSPTGPRYRALRHVPLEARTR